MNATELAYRSANLRAERARIRHNVKRYGLALSVLMRERAPALEGCEVRRIVHFLPAVGDTKAHRIMLGLPACGLLRDLIPSDRELLVERIATHERAVIARNIKRRGDHATTDEG